MHIASHKTGPFGLRVHDRFLLTDSIVARGRKKLPALIPACSRFRKTTIQWRGSVAERRQKLDRMYRAIFIRYKPNILFPLTVMTSFDKFFNVFLGDFWHRQYRVSKKWHAETQCRPTAAINPIRSNPGGHRAAVPTARRKSDPPL